MQTYDFKEKTAIVTGGASGIGYAVANGFAMGGANVAIIDINEEAAISAANTLKKEGYNAIGIACDVADEKAVKEMVQTVVDTFGQLDIAYNNAGIHAPVSKTADAFGSDFDRIIGVNLKGIWNCMKYELQHITRHGNGGFIVNASSQSGLVGTAGLGAYTASKHAVVGLTKCTALEYVKEGITINCVCPGTSDTPMVSNAIAGNPEHMANLIDTIPAGRLGKAEEIASAVLWLCTPGARFMVGQTIVPDGGFTVQ